MNQTLRLQYNALVIHTDRSMTRCILKYFYQKVVVKIFISKYQILVLEFDMTYLSVSALHFWTTSLVFDTSHFWFYTEASRPLIQLAISFSTVFRLQRLMHELFCESRLISISNTKLFTISKLFYEEIDEM